MKQETRFTNEYKAKLKSNIKFLNLEQYIQAKTGYSVKFSVVLDNKIGYVYAVQISLDDFKTYSKWIVKSTGKAEIKRELLEFVSHFDFKHKKRGGTTKQITKQIGSSALEIECCGCGEEKPVNGGFHRNTSSSYKYRGGYCPLCFDCANARAVEIMKKRGFHTAIIFLSALYDRAYSKSLADEIADIELSIVEKFGLYFRRLNLHPGVKGKDTTFTNSDITFEQNRKGYDING